MNFLSRHPVLRSPRRLAGISIVALLALVSCSRVLLPASDSTPPTLRWNVQNVIDSTSQDFSGNGTLTVRVGDRYRVTLFADDPQGVHIISLAASTGWSCVSGDIGQNSGPGLAVPETQTFSPDSDGYVLTTALILRNAPVGPFSCPAGWTFTGATTTFIGSAENYYGGAVTGHLVFDVEP